MAKQKLSLSKPPQAKSTNENVDFEKIIEQQIKEIDQINISSLQDPTRTALDNHLYNETSDNILSQQYPDLDFASFEEDIPDWASEAINTSYMEKWLNCLVGSWVTEK